MFALIARTVRAWLCLMVMLVPSVTWAATPVGTTITNTAQVIWKVGANTAGASVQHQITVSPYAAGPDLAISMTGPAQAAPGVTAIWKAIITDIGPVNGDGAQATFTLPPGVTNVSGVCAVLTSGACGAVTVGASTPAGTPVTVTLPNLPVNGRVEITLRGVAPAATGTINTQAQVSIAGQVDPAPANNAATVQTQVLAGAATTGTLSGRVWLDVNHDRIRNSGEFLFEGFTIRIYDALGTSLVRTATTNASGVYSVTGLPAGLSYQIEFRDRAGNVVFGLPVTTESSGTPTGFASTLSCSSLAETTAPNLVMPFTMGNCYSLTNGGSSSQVQRSGRIQLALQPGDNVVEQSLPLDPSGVVYDSVTRLPVAGATVTFNGPAGFDPAVHLMGGLANQNQVTGAEGFYQFLLVGNAPSGNYTLSVTPPAGYTSPSAAILPSGTLDPTGLGLGGVFLVQAQSGPPTGVQPATHYFVFSLALGDPNVINNHIPIDPSSGPGGQLVLSKTASKTVAGVGDFLQYLLQLSNTGTAAVAGATVVDRLPPGLRYRAGTARINGANVTPTISADGRTLTFAIGTVAAAASLEIKYVTEVTSGTPLGEAVNIAQATAAGGIRSLAVRATITIKEDLFRSRTILMGRVIEVGNSGPKLAQAGAGAVPIVSGEAGLCNAEQFFGKGVENARLYMEDGTYVRTDKEGKWHIEGVKPGTHVVQLDTKSLPEGYEAVLCEDNTRHAGKAFSQFVNVRGGTLWRADFYVRNTGKSIAAYEAGHQLSVTPVEGGAKVKLAVKGATAAVRNLSMTLTLPKGLAYVPGSARLNGAAATEPQVMDDILVFRTGDANGKWSQTLEFETKGALAAGATVKAVTQFVSADGEARRAPVINLSLDNITPRRMLVSKSEVIQYKQSVTSTSPAVPASAGQPAAAQPQLGMLNIYAPGSEKFDAAWLAGAEQGLDVVFPTPDFNPGVNATKIFVKHHPSLKVKVTMNGVPVDSMNFEGSEQNARKTVALSRWASVGLQGGQNKIVATALDADGKEVARAERIVHFSSGVVEARLVPEASMLIADGRTPPVIAVRMFDASGKPVRYGSDGEFTLQAPYQSLEVVQNRDARPLLDASNNKARWRVSEDGIALIKLQPTTNSGEAELTFNFQGRAPQVIRAWLKPEMRDWILVGLGEGTVGQRKLSGALESLPRDQADEKLWKDGRVAFFAKGQVKGDFLVTMAYDTDKERVRTGGNQGDRLFQSIDRKQYYTIYGDVTSAQHDAPSTRKLYLRIEKNQFYALFGDFNTGMTVTELSRYSRTLNGVKSEFRGQNVSYTAFATRTSQAFVKDELRPDGTSGTYRLTRGNIVPNSDKVSVETRDRFRNEVIVKSELLARGIDYEIDYTLGTLFFRKAIPGKDQSFNPIYIIIDYESDDPNRDERITAGGRVAVRTNDGRAEVGVSAVREGTLGARGDLRGADAAVQIDDKTRLRAEYAHTSREAAGTTASGNAYLVEVKRQDANVAATAYVRGQQGSFGLGQQAAAASGTTRMGGDVSVKVAPDVTVNALAAHERVETAGVTAQRSRVEARTNLVKPEYSGYVGGRIVRDQLSTGETLNSNQLVAGGSRKVMDGRLNLRVDGEFNINGTSGSGSGTSTDFPHRMRVGADYKVNEKVSLFLDQEFTFGGHDNTQTTRVGMKSKPWDGADSTSALNFRQTPDGPAVSSSSTMSQSFKLTPTLTVTGGMDRTKTLVKPNTPVTPPVNPLVPAAQGAAATGGASTQSVLPAAGLVPLAPVEDYVAVFAGMNWIDGPWGATARAEMRQGQDSDRINLAATLHRDIKSGQAIAATALYTDAKNATSHSRALDLRLSYAFRPIDSLWIVLSRLDYIQEDSDATGGQRSRRMITNNNVNYQMRRDTQVAFQYGAKYVFDTYDRQSVAGLTQLFGAEVRHDLGNRFDLGVHGSALYSHASSNMLQSYGLSVGFSPVTNLWLGLGYNFAGFRDRDFTSANATAKGWYLYLRVKADQEMREKDKAGQRQLMFEEASR